MIHEPFNALQDPRWDCLSVECGYTVPSIPAVEPSIRESVGRAHAHRKQTVARLYPIEGNRTIGFGRELRKGDPVGQCTNEVFCRGDREVLQRTGIAAVPAKLATFVG
jgi:hypothetical protein